MVFQPGAVALYDYAGEIGLDTVLTGMNHYRKALGEYGEMWFSPAPLLEKLVTEGKRAEMTICLLLRFEAKSN